MRLLIIFTLISVLTACATQGKLEYITKNGEHKTACETEYTWQPSVDVYAVEYILSYCARKAAEKGHTIVDQALLNMDLTLPAAPSGKPWTFEYAKQLHKQNKLSDKEYGYIIAYVDLGLNKD